MPVSVRQNYHRHPPILSFLLLLCFALSASASPLVPTPTRTYDLVRRTDPVVRFDNGTIVVLDPQTSEPVAQGSASDGGGQDFNVPALIWLVFCFVIGVPLALSGIRLWRATTGAAVGLVCLVCVWASFVNTLNASGISDLLLTIIVLGAFALGFILGLFSLGRAIGVAFLGFLGGFAVAVRIVLFRPNLLVPTFFVNWLIITVFGMLSFILVLARQRMGITMNSASVGTFLVGLGIDLLINRQSGMSFGLRYLFDQNNAHLVELLETGWHPPISTEIIMAVTLALTPALAYFQHLIFKAPFRPPKHQTILSTIKDDFDDSDPDSETAPSLPPVAQQEVKINLSLPSPGIDPSDSSSSLLGKDLSLFVSSDNPGTSMLDSEKEGDPEKGASRFSME